MRVAVTGGIGEGKSTVLAMVREMGYSVASSDAVAREVFADEGVQRRLAEVVGGEAPVSRDRLRAALAASPDVRRSVNRIMHGEIRSRMDATGAAFHEVPLLLEACLQGRYDRVWVVSCGAEEQRRRLRERYGSDEAVDALVATQLPSSIRIAFADLVIRTNEPLETVRRVLFEAVNRLRLS